jgi:hypothetical protein
MIRESDIEKRVCAAAKVNGWVVHPKAAHGTRGWPDRTFTKTDRVIFVEFKAPGKKPTALQIYTHTQLRNSGYKVYVIDSIEDGARLFAG